MPNGDPEGRPAPLKRQPSLAVERKTAALLTDQIDAVDDLTKAVRVLTGEVKLLRKAMGGHVPLIGKLHEAIEDLLNAVFGGR